MRNYTQKILVLLFSLLSCSAFADTLSIINTLTREYGKVMLNRGNSSESQDSKDIRSFSFHAKYGEIARALDIISVNKWCVKSISVEGIDENVASVTISAVYGTTEYQDDLKVDLFIETITDRHIPWPRSEEALKAEEKNQSIFSKKKIRNELSVNEISTDFGDSVLIKGTTYQSQAVFKELFVTLNSIPAISAPFFERGTYYDVEDGRKMKYIIRCRWGQKAVKPASDISK